MNFVLLSGGSGKRLWPLSNDVRSKQFLKLFNSEDNEKISMVQQMYAGLKSVDNNANITVATSATQVSALKNQVGADVQISVEPGRRDTFPAIALCANYLKDVENVGLDEAVVVCPVDPYVEKDWFEALFALGEQVEKSDANLVLLGIEPTYPSEKYGYIIPASSDVVANVDCFKEKPDKKTAAEYIEKGALWNGGVFGFKLRYLIEKSHELLDFIDYNDLYSKYNDVNKISFDYAVAEKEDKISVMRFDGMWKDLGTWNTLTEVLPDKITGNAVMDDTCENVHILNELDMPVLAMGLKDVVVAAGPEGILVANKDQSSYMKPFVDAFEGDVKYAEKSWGEYRVIDETPGSITIRVTLEAGNMMKYHSHELRDEVWNIVSGKGIVTVDGMKNEVSVGDVITIQAGCRHTIEAVTRLSLIEVQIGKEIRADDKQVYRL